MTQDRKLRDIEHRETAERATLAPARIDVAALPCDLRAAMQRSGIARRWHPSERRACGTRSGCGCRSGGSDDAVYLSWNGAPVALAD